MASSSQIASTSIPLASPWKYDVFLSFRGEETRHTITAHLRDALEGKTIKVFMDDRQLRRGATIADELLIAIEKSRFSLIVLSPDYASSKWCLDELVKIYECMQARKTIIPIFYNLDPSHVRRQRGTFEEAFNRHANNTEHSIEKVQRWRTALERVGNMSGWDSAAYQSETKLIKKIVKSLYKQLVCAGCNGRVGGDGLECLDALWHRDCLCCKGCDKPFTVLEFWNYENQPYHADCYKRQCHVCDVCKKYIPENAEGKVEYMEDPIWRQRYCPSHVQDGTPRCCSCERLKPRQTPYYKLPDDRILCPQCKESIINNDNGRLSICHEVLEFYKGLKVKVEKIPVRLVSKQEIIEVLKERSEKSDPQFPVIRAVCLLEERSVTSSICWRRSQLGYEVEEILIWYGLPRILTGSLLAQQMMSAWLWLNCCPNLSLEDGKGICRYFANRWLNDSSNYDPPKKLSEFEKQLSRKRKVELHCDALQRAKAAERKHGLRMTLKTIRKTGKFPV